MTHGTAKVDKTTLSQQDDVLAVLQGETVNLEKGMISLVNLTIDDINDLYLGLDVGLGPAVLLQPLDLERKIKIVAKKGKRNCFKKFFIN